MASKCSSLGHSCVDLELRREGWVRDKDLGIDGILEEARKRGDEMIQGESEAREKEVT